MTPSMVVVNGIFGPWPSGNRQFESFNGLYPVIDGWIDIYSGKPKQLSLRIGYSL